MGSSGERKKRRYKKERKGGGFLVSAALTPVNRERGKGRGRESGRRVVCLRLRGEKGTKGAEKEEKGGGGGSVFLFYFR